MTKKELKDATNDAIIIDYIMTYSHLTYAYNFTNRGTKQAEKHITDLENEILKRGILTIESIEYLRR